jgi:hypothetical protein
VTSLDVRVKRKPAVDQAGFEQVLAAAYVLQQHNDSLRAKDPRLDTAWILTQVAETQSLLRAGSLGLEAAARLVADRLRTMTDSAGVSISLTRDGYLHGIAESGAAAKVPGSSIVSHSLVATERLKNGRPFQSADAQRDIRLDIPGCRELGVRALLAAPVLRLGKIAGLVEVRWNKPDAFHECDVRTCQLMAALVGGVLEREADSWTPPAANPQASTVHSAFELASDEEPVGNVPDDDNDPAPQSENPAAEATPSNSASDSSPDSKNPSDLLAAQCRVCGRPFLANEAFCGNCSMPRVAGAAAENLQGKWASLWYMQQAQETQSQETIEEREVSAPPQLASDSPELHAQEEEVASPVKETPQQSVWRRPEKIGGSTRPELPSAFTRPLVPDAVIEDALARDAGIGIKIKNATLQDVTSPPSWDDTIRAAWGRAGRALHQQMGRRIALAAMAAMALIFVLVIWAWPAPASHLTWFESLLVKLGVAEVPQRAPVAPAGNPDVQVWVDVHTALYYCPGSNLYGKTPGGKFATQADAQMDHFEPATGALCE